MQFESFSALMAMDGHGIFVWPVYAIALVVLLALAISPLRKKRRFFVEESMRQRRQQAAAQEDS